MAAVAFAVTEVGTAHHWTIGTKDRKKRFTVQMPESAWLAAGVAWDASSYFTAITETHWGPGILVTDFQAHFGLFGTDAADSMGGVTASTLKVAGYGTKHGTAADDVLAAIPDATDLKAITAIRLTVHGY